MQNKESEFLVQRQFGIETKLNFDIFNRREKKAQIIARQWPSQYDHPLPKSDDGKNAPQLGINIMQELLLLALNPNL